jgi:molybdate transport system permease protein
MKHKISNSLSNKIILVILGLIVLTYFLFVALPILAVFLRIEPGQISSQLQDSQIIDTVKLSLFTSAIATLIVFILAVPTAYFMATRKFPGKAVIDTVIDLPFVLPPAVAGVGFRAKRTLRSVAEHVWVCYTRLHNRSYNR